MIELLAPLGLQYLPKSWAKCKHSGQFGCRPELLPLWFYKNIYPWGPDNIVGRDWGHVVVYLVLVRLGHGTWLGSFLSRWPADKATVLVTLVLRLYTVVNKFILSPEFVHLKSVFLLLNIVFSQKMLTCSTPLIWGPWAVVSSQNLLTKPADQSGLW